MKSRRKHVWKEKKKKNNPEKHSLKDMPFKKFQALLEKTNILYLLNRTVQTRSIGISTSLRPINVTVQRIALLTSDVCRFDLSVFNTIVLNSLLTFFFFSYF